MSDNCEDIKSLENDIEEIETEEQLNTILSENTNVLVNFYSSYCVPCRFLDMEIRKLKHLPILKIVKINIHNSPDLSQKFNIVNVPILYLYINSSIKTQLIGYSTNHIQTVLGLICQESAY
jgi:thiol-disulfide isomerase/thioredoxin